MAYAIDFIVDETHTNCYTTVGFSEEYTLEAGDKLTDQADLVAIASKTVPAGYRVKVGVVIRAEVEKLP